MNPAYEIALKEIGSKAWKGETRVSFVETMLQGAGIAAPERSASAYLEWGHPVDLEQARPGDIAVVTTGSAKAASDTPVFFIRRTGAFIEALTLALDDQDVRPHRFSTKRIKGISRPPKRVEQDKPFEFYSGRKALEVEQVEQDLASFIAPGAASKMVELRKADPAPHHRPQGLNQGQPITDRAIPTPASRSKARRKRWLINGAIAVAVFVAAKFLGAF